MSHWREAPRPAAHTHHHAVTHSEPIVNPAAAFPSQQHHHSSSSYTGKKALYASDWQTEAEISVTLEPISQAMTLIRTAVQTRKIPHLQPSTACAISAIRSLLLATDCLSRDSALLTTFPILAKIRKTILANLAELVALARSASQVGGSPTDQGHAYFQTHTGEQNAEMEEFKEAELEGMLKSSEETFNNVRVFLKAIVRCGIALPERKDADVEPGSAGSGSGSGSARGIGSRPGSGSGTLGPLAQQQQQHSRGASSPGETMMGNRTRQSSANSIGVLPKRERERQVNLQARSMSEIRLGTRPTVRTQFMGHQGQTPSTASSSFLEVGVEDTGPPTLDRKSSRSRLGPNAGSVSSVSSVGSSNDYQPHSHHRGTSSSSRQSRSMSEPVDIVVGIGMTFDSLLSVTAALIGHVQCHTVASHPSSHALLVELSRETIDKIRDLLAIVEIVVGHQPTARTHGREIVALDHAKTQMYETTSDLVEAAERVASTPFKDAPGDEDELNKERLLSSASIIMRPARECVRLVKICGNRKDAIENPGLGIRLDTTGSYQSRIDVSAENGQSEYNRRFSASKRASYASSSRSSISRSRDETSESEAMSGGSSLLEAYVRDFSGPRSAPLDRPRGETFEEEQEIMITPAEQAARNRPLVSWHKRRQD